MAERTFISNYERLGVIKVCAAMCHICGNERECLGIDSSDDEYGCGWICGPCIELLFNERKKEVPNGESQIPIDDAE